MACLYLQRATLLPRIYRGAKSIKYAAKDHSRRAPCLLDRYERIRRGPECFPPISYPEANVDALADLLEDKHIGDFHQIVRLKNQTHTQVIREIKRVSEQSKPDDLLLIYYSGHAIFDA